MKQGYILLEDRLHGEYKEAFSKVSLYSNTNLIGIDTDSELMMELLDSMLMAQSEGRPVTDVVGTDIQAFCENFFSGMHNINSSHITYQYYSSLL